VARKGPRRDSQRFTDAIANGIDGDMIRNLPITSSNVQNWRNRLSFDQRQLKFFPVFDGGYAAAHRISHLPRFNLVANVHGDVGYSSRRESKHINEVQVCSAVNGDNPFWMKAVNLRL
jgi:hypothetical protein